MAQSAVSLGAADTRSNEFDPEPRVESAEVILADVNTLSGNDYYSDVDDFFADIDDIAAYRDQTEGVSSSRDQILQLWNPAEPPNALPSKNFISGEFNNSPYVDEFVDGLPTGAVLNVMGPSDVVPGATEMDVMVGEMRALSRKEDAGTISDDERRLLEFYREYMGGRTGYADGGMVSQMDYMGPPTGPDPQFMDDSYEEAPVMVEEIVESDDPLAGMDDFMGGVLEIEVFEVVDPMTARADAFDESILAASGVQMDLGPRAKAQLDQILGRTGDEVYG